MGKIISWIINKIGAKAFFVGVQFAGSTAFVVAHAVALGFIFYVVQFFYNQYNAFMNFVSNMSTATQLTGLATNFLHAIGFFNAFNDVFIIFSPFLTAFLVYKLSMITFSIARALSNEIFKLGVIWQQ